MPRGSFQQTTGHSVTVGNSIVSGKERGHIFRPAHSPARAPHPEKIAPRNLPEAGVTNPLLAEDKPQSPAQSVRGWQGGASAGVDGLMSPGALDVPNSELSLVCGGGPERDLGLCKRVTGLTVQVLKGPVGVHVWVPACPGSHPQAYMGTEVLGGGTRRPRSLQEPARPSGPRAFLPRALGQAGVGGRVPSSPLCPARGLLPRSARVVTDRFLSRQALPAGADPSSPQTSRHLAGSLD